MVPLVALALLALAAVPAFAQPPVPMPAAQSAEQRILTEVLGHAAPADNVVDFILEPFSDNSQVCPLPEEPAAGEPAQEEAPPTLEEIALINEGRRLFNSPDVFEQQPSLGFQPSIVGQRISCADCHADVDFSDDLTHAFGPTETREVVPRQTPHLLRIADTAPFAWDGRFDCIQAVSKAAIEAPFEMNAGREPTQHELDALAAFVETLDVPDAVPGVDFDPALAAQGEVLFNAERGRDPMGRSFPGQTISCATCHIPEQNFTDNKFHIVLLPLFIAPDLDPIDPAHIENGRVVGFNTPVLRGLRFSAPYFHEGGSGDPSGQDTPVNEPPDLALLSLVAFYSERFEFDFTLREQLALVEFLKSL